MRGGGAATTGSLNNLNMCLVKLLPVCACDSSGPGAQPAVKSQTHTATSLSLVQRTC
jgi:hypothetical protein